MCETLSGLYSFPALFHKYNVVVVNPDHIITNMTTKRIAFTDANIAQAYFTVQGRLLHHVPRFLGLRDLARNVMREQGGSRPFRREFSIVAYLTQIQGI